MSRYVGKQSFDCSCQQTDHEGGPSGIMTF